MLDNVGFVHEVYQAIKNRPEEWRKGQACFNFIESKYHVGRIVQFKHHIDCFYDDSVIKNFIAASWMEIEKQNNNINN